MGGLAGMGLQSDGPGLVMLTLACLDNSWPV
jgi:hypothetical protein